jgi:hypothetical protein
MPDDDHYALEAVRQERSDGPLDQRQSTQAKEELRSAPGQPAKAFGSTSGQYHSHSGKAGQRQAGSFGLQGSVRHTRPTTPLLVAERR